MTTVHDRTIFNPNCSNCFEADSSKAVTQLVIFIKCFGVLYKPTRFLYVGCEKEPVISESGFSLFDLEVFAVVYDFTAL
jgi:hypothetical protein